MQFLTDLVSAFTAATSGSSPSADVVLFWAAARDNPALIVVGGIDSDAAQAFEIGPVTGGVTTDRPRPSFGDQQAETVRATCSLTVPSDGTSTPESVAAEAASFMAAIKAALPALSTPDLGQAWLSSTSLDCPDQSAGFGALVIFTVAGEFLIR